MSRQACHLRFRALAAATGRCSSSIQLILTSADTCSPDWSIQTGYAQDLLWALWQPAMVLGTSRPGRPLQHSLAWAAHARHIGASQVLIRNSNADSETCLHVMQEVRAVLQRLAPRHSCCTEDGCRLCLVGPCMYRTALLLVLSSKVAGAQPQRRWRLSQTAVKEKTSWVVLSLKAGPVRAAAYRSRRLLT